MTSEMTKEEVWEALKAPHDCLCIECCKARNGVLNTAIGESIIIGVATAGAEIEMTSFRYACEICGNKRCPHHTDHRLECTGSNEPGQKGSIYENA